jgi:cytoskeletal protein CcmA (bactofilin family)
MWSDRGKENTFGKSSPTPRNEPETASQPGLVSDLAVIGKAMVIRGHVRSKEGLYVDGEVDGSLELADSRLTVGPHGRVTADVTAREIEVMGSVTGDLDAAKKITIRKGGRLVGDLRTPAIVIEEGAYFKGKIEILDNVERPGAEAAQRNIRKIAARA